MVFASALVHPAEQSEHNCSGIATQTINFLLPYVEVLGGCSPVEWVPLAQDKSNVNQIKQTGQYAGFGEMCSRTTVRLIWPRLFKNQRERYQ